MNAINRSLMQRRRRKICNLCIRWCVLGYVGVIYCVVTWLHIAVQCNVEVLELELLGYPPYTKFSLPLCLFSCGSLRSLTLNLNSCSLVLPSAVGFTNLQSLSVSPVKMLNKSFGDWISSLCKSLKELRLYQH